MELTKQEAKDVVFEESEDWEAVTSAETTEHSRWSVYYEQVFKHIPTNKHYKFEWSQGATEQQYESPFEYEDSYTPVEVHQVEKTITIWEAIN